MWAGQVGFLSGCDKDAKRSRRDYLDRAGIEPPMPDVPDEDVIGYVSQLGLSMAGGMGEVPLSASEIMAWAAGMGVDLAPRDFWLLRRMSVAYCAGVHAERAPFMPQDTRAAIASATMMAGLQR